MDQHAPGDWSNESLPLANRPETVIGVVVTFLVISALAVCLRLFVRLRERLYGMDDLFVVLAAIGCLAGSIIVCLMPSHGLGKHFPTLSAETRVEYFKSVWATNLAYCFSTTFIKISILAQYLRLFQDSQLARKATWVILILVAMWGTTFFLLALLSCTPVAKNWNFQLEGKCVGWGSKDPNEFFATWMAHASSNMFLDSAILMLPVPFIRSMRMSGKTRMGLITLFLLGGIAVALSVARVISISIRRIGTVPVFDPSFYTPMVYIFSVLELNMAILTASIPIFWPLVTSLATNKILIVNEIEIRTERIDENYALAEQGKGFGGTSDDDGPDGRISRVSVAWKSEFDASQRSNSRVDRKHRATPSNASRISDKTPGLYLTTHTSNESQRNFNLTHQSSDRSLSSLSQLYESPDMTHARYQNKFMQDWAVPNFDSDLAPLTQKKSPTEQTMFSASAQRAQVPYDHIRAQEK